MTDLSFRAHQPWGEVVLRWWRSLDDDAGGRAALRRANDVTAAVMSPAYHRLYRQLHAAGWPDAPWQNDGLAAAAGLLAHVRELDERSLPIAMSQRDGDKPRVSPLRFRRLLESQDVDTLFTGLRRTLPLLQHRANPLALATDVVGWGDRVRKRWAYEYEWPEQKTSA